MAPATIELETHAAEALLRMSEIKKFSDRSGYACQLEIESRGFCATRPFYFEQFYLSRCIEALKQMSSGMPGSAELRAEFESDYFRLRSNELGHVVVEGELHEHSALAQTLRFSFRTDQTVLAPLADSLAQWLAA